MCVRVLCTSSGLLSLYSLIRSPSPREPGVETPDWWPQLCEGRDCSWYDHCVSNAEHHLWPRVSVQYILVEYLKVKNLKF